MADSICPTFAANTITQPTRRLDDFQGVSITGSTQTLGTVNNNTFYKTVGSQNNAWNNGELSSAAPTFSSSLIDFGNTGRQS